MGTLRIEPGPAGHEAQKLPLCYANPLCPGNVTQSFGEIFESLDGGHLVGAGDVQQLLHRQPASRAGVLVEAGLKSWRFTSVTVSY